MRAAFAAAWLCGDKATDRIKRFVASKLADRKCDAGSEWQRLCPELVPGLRSLPFWSVEDAPEQLGFVTELEANAAVMREELLAMRGSGGFQAYQTPAWAADGTPAAGERRSGAWNVAYLQLHGALKELTAANLARCPATARLLREQVSRAYEHAFFSALAPGTHVQPHTGPTNKKLRVYLPLVVPADEAAGHPPEAGLAQPDPLGGEQGSVTGSAIPVAVASAAPERRGCRLRVGAEARAAEEGKAIIFDDSFEHEAWNAHEAAGASRLVLILDVWHPDLLPAEVKFLQFLRSADLKLAQQLSKSGGLAAEADFHAVLEAAAAAGAPDEQVFGAAGQG